MTVDKTDWKDLREFKSLDLEQSFVLSWEISGETLQIDVDLNLRSGHALYEPPRPAEKACFRPGHIDFPQCSAVRMSGENGDIPATLAIQRLGSGKISGLRRIGEGKYQFEGGFGSVIIVADRPMVRLKDPTI